MQDCVAGAFDAVFVEPSAERAHAAHARRARGRRADDAALREHLQRDGLRRSRATAQRLRGVLSSRRVQVASEATRARIERLLKSGLKAATARARGTGASHDIGPMNCSRVSRNWWR